MNQYFEVYKTEFVLCLDLPGHCQSIQLNDGTIQWRKKISGNLVGWQFVDKELANFPYL